jgi:hypothetical protein
LLNVSRFAPLSPCLTTSRSVITSSTCKASCHDFRIPPRQVLVPRSAAFLALKHPELSDASPLLDVSDEIFCGHPTRTSAHLVRPSWNPERLEVRLS